MAALHVQAPQPDLVIERNGHCPKCKTITRFIMACVPWYGPQETCLKCGTVWNDGWPTNQPHTPSWRCQNIRAARESLERFHKLQGQTNQGTKGQSHGGNCQCRKEEDGAGDRVQAGGHRKGRADRDGG